MTGPTLLAVAHGSRDPRSPAAARALTERVRAEHPELDVRLAFLDLSEPKLDAVLTELDEAVVVPLLLGAAFHARVDVPGAITEAVTAHPTRQFRVADVLGTDQRVERIALRRLAEAGVRPSDRDVGVVLAGAGSSFAPANQAVAELAARWAAHGSWMGASAAFATAAPSVPEAVAALRRDGADRVAVALWFLAPGLLPDKVITETLEADPAAVITAPLATGPSGPDADLAGVVMDRYTAMLDRVPT